MASDQFHEKWAKYRNTELTEEGREKREEGRNPSGRGQMRRVNPIHNLTYANQRRPFGWPKIRAFCKNPGLVKMGEAHPPPTAGGIIKAEAPGKA